MNLERVAPIEVKKVVYCGKVKWLPTKIDTLTKKMNRKGYYLVKDGPIHIQFERNFTYYSVLNFRKKKYRN